MGWDDNLNGWLAALGIGLLIGVVRERHGPQGDAAPTRAGLRTHAVLALAAAVAMRLGPAALTVLLVAVAALAIASYWASHREDPGLTGEMALLLTPMLAAFAQRDPAVAAALGVIAAILLQAKRPLRRLAREIISEGEIHDVLLLAAAALVVLPLLPDHPIDPWRALRPQTLWRLVVLILAVGMLGHVALRLVGVRWGLPVAGFFAGFASSTAAVAGFGGRVRQQPGVLVPAVAAALLSNLASLVLLSAILGAVAPGLLRSLAWPLAAAHLVLMAAGAFGLRGTDKGGELPDEPPARAFRLGHALIVAGVIAVVLLLSAWMRQVFGDAGALAAATLAALAEVHAAAATVAQLAAAGGIQPGHARWGVVGLLAAAAASKSVLAFAAGGARFGWRVAAGLWASVAAAAGVMLLE